MVQKRVPMTVSLPPDLAQQFEKLAKIEEKNKSQLFQDMFRAYEQRRLEPEVFELQRYGARKAYEYIIEHPFRWAGRLDSTQAIRKMRRARFGPRSSK